MSDDDRAIEAPTPRYEIRVQGRLGTRWAAWLDDMDLRPEGDGTTVLRGPVVDQAALHGLLQKLRDLGLPLVALDLLPPNEPTTGHQPRHPEGNRS